MEYELTDVRQLLESPDWYLDGGLEKNIDTGEKTRTVIPAKVREAVQTEKERIYWADVDNQLKWFIQSFNRKLEQSPDKAATRALEVSYWETVFDVKTDPAPHSKQWFAAQHNEVTRRAWRQILSGERNYTAKKGHQILLGHSRAEARFKYLQWLKELPQQQGTVWTLETDHLKDNAQAAKVRAWQDVVDYFNTEGAEVQLFTSENANFNEAAQTDLEMIKAYGELGTTATRELLTEQLINGEAKAEADKSELQALFDAKLSEAIHSGKARTPQGFAKVQANKLGKAWADIFDLFPIAERYTEHLKGIAEATEQPAAVAEHCELPQADEVRGLCYDFMEGRIIGGLCLHKRLEQVTDGFDLQKVSMLRRDLESHLNELEYSCATDPAKEKKLTNHVAPEFPSQLQLARILSDHVLNLEQTILGQEQPATVTDTSAPAEPNKGGTGAESEPRRKAITFTDGATIIAIHNGLKAFFPDRETDLLTLLEGGTVNEPLHFKYNQRKLADVFDRAKCHGKLTDGKSEIARWMAANFTYLNRKEKKAIPCNFHTVRDTLSVTPKGRFNPSERIPIEGLPALTPAERKQTEVQ
jgi:hypothetical protein